MVETKRQDPELAQGPQIGGERSPDRALIENFWTRLERVFRESARWEETISEVARCLASTLFVREGGLVHRERGSWKPEGERLGNWTGVDEDFALAAGLAVSRRGRTSGAVALEVERRPWMALVLGEGERLLVFERTSAVEAMGEERLSLVASRLERESWWYARLDERDRLVYHDDLTGLYNHRYLDLAIDAELKREARFKTPFSVLFFDIDRFKGVNDTHGHLVGSALLREIGAILKRELRDVDTVIRYGGDEFVALVVGSDARQGFQVAERIRLAIERTDFAFDDGMASRAVRVTVSIGVASCPEQGRDKQAILRLADELMYAGKRGGRNRVTVIGWDGHPATSLREVKDGREG